MNPSALPDYSSYSVNDFVLDDFFRRWVFQPDEQTMSFWHTYMLNHPEQQANVEQASSLLLHLRVQHDDLAEASRERIWQVLEAAYDSQASPHNLQSKQSGPTVRRLVGYPFRTWQVAASLVGILLLTGGSWVIWHGGQRQAIHTAYSEQQTVQLPDGSLVQLNGNSTLTYASDWQESENREVWLEGEAFFKVTKQQASGGRLKFITHTPDLDISVLGTQFNVNTRRGNTQVVLAEGKVSLTKPNDKKAGVILMKPGDMAVTQAGIEQVTIQRAKPQLHTAWTKNQFAFENTPLREIARQLEDTQGVVLIFEDNDMAEYRFTGNLASQDLETLITTLATTFNLQADRTENRIYLHRL